MLGSCFKPGISWYSKKRVKLNRSMHGKHAQVSLEDWIERRIGGEVEIQQAVKPGCVFHLEDGLENGCFSGDR